MILWPQSGLAMTGASCIDSSLVESVDGGPVWEGSMHQYGFQLDFVQDKNLPGAVKAK